MPAFVMCHTATGAVLYRVGEASDEEIDYANQRLREAGTQYRLLPASAVSQNDHTLVADHALC
jgi:hypothetical protein